MDFDGQQQQQQQQQQQRPQGIGELERRVLQPVSMISLVSESVGSTEGLCERFFKAVSSCRVNVVATAASELTLTCAVEGRHTAAVVEAVHQAFNTGNRASGSVSVSDASNAPATFAQVAVTSVSGRQSPPSALRHPLGVPKAIKLT